METIYKKFESNIQDIDTKQGIVKIAVSAFGNYDSDNDIILPGAWKKTITERIKRIKHLYNHDRYILLGAPLEMFETSEHLIAVSKMNMYKQIAKDVYSDYIFMAEIGRTIEHSVGFVGDIFEKNDKGGFNFAVNKLYEYSSLSFLGANENTPLIELKQMLKMPYSDERYEQLEKRIKELELKMSQNSVPEVEVMPEVEIIPTTNNIPTKCEAQIDYSKITNYFKNGK